MIPQINITPSIYYVGVNDRTKDLFESMWPLPHGVSYNSYLIVDEKITLIDTVDICYSEQFFRQIERIIGDRPIDYLVIDHMEPDHSGSIGMLQRHYPNIQLVGNKKTFNMLQAYYPDLKADLITVNDGDTLSTGNHNLTFIMAPMVHWPEVMFTYDATEGVLFSADAFGTFGSLDSHVLDHKLSLEMYYTEMYRYYACIVGKYGPFVQKALTKVLGMNLTLNAICSTHGPVWTNEGFPRALAIYDQLSKYDTQKGAVVLYGSMYGNTTVMADTIARGLGEAGIKEVVCHDVSRTNPSYILRDLFRYRALIVGCPTYSNEIYMPIQNMLNMIRLREVKNHICAIFGSCSWAGQAVRKLTPFAEEMGWELVGTPLEQMGAPNEEDLNKAFELGKEVADRLHELYPEA
ncbi:FprA family A-type flavoprotein [Porphyromonas sp.]